jgi:hypothetical protein
MCSSNALYFAFCSGKGIADPAGRLAFILFELEFQTIRPAFTAQKLSFNGGIEQKFCTVNIVQQIRKLLVIYFH